MNQLKKWWPTILPVVTLILSTVEPSLRDAILTFMKTHPGAGSAMMLGYSVLTHILPSPVSK